MSDATVIKPSPGKRNGKNKPSDLAQLAASAGEADCTVVITPSKSKERNTRLPKLGDNPLVDEASVLLSMAAQIRCTAAHGDIASLRQACMEKVRDYEAALRRQQVEAEQIEAARFCLCCFIDEIVLSTNWGGQSVWSSDSLLSTFHHQTSGGEHFYVLLDECLASPFAKIQLLELQYLCLSLGFVGKMSLEERGQDKLANYRQQAFDSINQARGELDPRLSPNADSASALGRETHDGLPLWVILAIFGVMLLSIYMTCSYYINSYSDQVFNQINALARWESAPVGEVEVDGQQLLTLQQRLQTEVSRGLIEITPESDRIRITLNSGDLFSPGSAEIKSSVLPVLQKLARVLEATDGRILITGHTDNQPIFTSRYPSNWHLSLARASAVANSMSVGTLLQGRLWPEGRGDSEPRGDNNSEAGRALNRRVEIDLLY